MKEKRAKQTYEENCTERAKNAHRIKETSAKQTSKEQEGEYSEIFKRQKVKDPKKHMKNNIIV